MNKEDQIPRASLYWLLSSLIAVTLPHSTHLPVWLLALCVSCIILRILIHQGRCSYPGRKLKSLIVFVSISAIFLDFGSQVLSTDATVTVLITGMSLKLLEMRHKRDILLVVFLCYFSVVTEFIYSQSIPMAIYMGVVLVLISTTMLSLNQSLDSRMNLRSLKYAATILGQSIPLMLVLFLAFPRVSPLWSVPVPNSSGKTGLSDKMSPGDIGKLTRSGEVAFRVQFRGAIPDKHALYWRGLTLTVFDGREWHQGFRRENQFLGNNPRRYHDWFREIQYLGDSLDYNIIMEATNNNWVFSLKIPRLVDERFTMSRDFQINSFRSIKQRLSYNMRSYRNHRLDLQIDEAERLRNLLLPQTGNPRSRAFALGLFETVGKDPQEYFSNVLQFFSSENFFYSLQPPLLGDNSVDDFLFETQEGFCEHYTSSFVYLMRAVGIPARVVLGYQGGEVNPYDNTLIVRQYDAHSWAEIWLEGQGWIRVDPTAAVAPERIDLGSDLSFQHEGGFLEDAGFTLLRFRDSVLLNNIRLRLESIDYAWNRWVLNYNQELQFALFSRFFSKLNKFKIVMSFLLLSLLSLLMAVIFILRPDKGRAVDPATSLYLKFCRFLAQKGYARQTGETPTAFAARLGKAQPQWHASLKNISGVYENLAFAGISNEEDYKLGLRSLARKIRLFKRQCRKLKDS